MPTPQTTSNMSQYRPFVNVAIISLACADSCSQGLETLFIWLSVNSETRILTANIAVIRYLKNIQTEDPPEFLHEKKQRTRGVVSDYMEKRMKEDDFREAFPLDYGQESLTSEQMEDLENKGFPRLEQIFWKSYSDDEQGFYVGFNGDREPGLHLTAIDVLECHTESDSCKIYIGYQLSLVIDPKGVVSPATKALLQAASEWSKSIHSNDDLRSLPGCQQVGVPSDPKFVRSGDEGTTLPQTEGTALPQTEETTLPQTPPGQNSESPNAFSWSDYVDFEETMI